MKLLTVTGISKKDERGFELKDISFTQEPFQNIAIAGETGSGKTTLLKIIAGLVQQDAGNVFFEGKKIIGPNDQLIPGHPGIAYLSQQFDLPHYLRVEQVLEYANQLTDEEAATLYDVCQISHLLKRRTDQLSGGERQRIAIARLLIGTPRLLLLDEPFSNMDMIHTHMLKSIIHDIGEKLQITCMMISHEPDDILSWANEIIVLRNGQIIQRGSPAQIYRQPVDEYVAGLFGKYQVFEPSRAAMFSTLAGNKDSKQKLFVRPENFTIASPDSNAPAGTVQKVFFFGSYWEIDVLVAGITLTIRTNSGHFVKGDTLYISLSPADTWYL